MAKWRSGDVAKRRCGEAGKRRRVNSDHLDFVDDQRGSAASEFVLLALPLFVPALIFFLSISQISRAEMESSMLAREALKAFVTGDNDAEGHLRVRLLLKQYNEISASQSMSNDLEVQSTSNPNSARVGGIDYSIRCSSSPCIVPGSEVELSLFAIVELNSEMSALTSSSSHFWGTDRQDVARERVAFASARGFVDKWN